MKNCQFNNSPVKIFCFNIPENGLNDKKLQSFTCKRCHLHSYCGGVKKLQYLLGHSFLMTVEKRHRMLSILQCCMRRLAVTLFFLVYINDIVENLNCDVTILPMTLLFSLS